VDKTTNDWLVHGGRLEAARAAFGGARADWLDLSTGINPHAWPHADACPVDWRALPDPSGLAALEAAAAECFGADPALVCALPGTEIGLRLLGTLLPVAAVQVVPSYGTHGAIFPTTQPIPADAMEEVAADRTILLANPNNPDGRLDAPARLLALARGRAPGAWLVVDEAFADTHPAHSLAGHVGPALPLILFRSFGKFFGLAGVRLGFVIAPPAIIRAFRTLLGDWPLSAAAIAIGTAACRDRDWIATMRIQLPNDAAALDAVLARHGLVARGASPLFRLIETPHAPVLFERLARAAILTRPFADRPEWLRFGLPGTPAALARLDQALRHG
jgi:cobalamin biosynthesis protein CobC